MQEEYWAAQDEVLWENQVTTLMNENVTLTDQNVALIQKITELQRMLQQAGIAIV